MAQHYPGGVPEGARALAADRRRPFAGVGVNAIIPARGGEVVRVFLAKRSIDGSTYPTIAATLILLSLFDFVVASSLVIWAGVASCPGWMRSGPRSTSAGPWTTRGALITLGVILLILLAVLLWFAEQIGDFKQRIAQGFAALRDRGYFAGSRSGRRSTGRAGSSPSSSS